MLKIATDYNGIGKIQYLLGQKGYDIWQSDYTEQVTLTVPVPVQEVDGIVNEITEATSAQAKIERDSELYYAKHGKELMIFDIDESV